MTTADAVVAVDRAGGRLLTFTGTGLRRRSSPPEAAGRS